MESLQDFLRTTYGFRSKFLDLNGLRYHYLDEGAGHTVILLHGNPTWSFMYRRAVASLRDSYRVIVPDHMGCGLSEKPGETEYEFDLERRVSDFGDLLGEVSLQDPITLVVHDWGGLIGLTWAVRNPARVSRVVVLNTAAFLVPPGKKLHWSIRTCRSSRLAASLILRVNLFARAAVYLGSRRGLGSETRKAFLAPYSSRRDRLAILKFIQDIPLEPGDRSYQTVLQTQEGLAGLRDVPMLICWGERDFVFDEDFLAEWKRRFPRASVRTYPHAGHYVLEDAWEEIIPEIRSFIQEGELQ